ncbi:TMV resistance protein N-like, partial [Prunus avium]|uniref:TMV resistance protein N-like n=1 Tax=Prunus avium TaxID=42229 RepID=A0A6P5RN07_PRUAV
MALITSESVSPSSSSSTNSWRNDVFISYRSADTRYNFTDHLYSNLQQKGIKTFMDTDYKRGEQMSPALFEEIEGSKISIIVFSENYGSSPWCLDELVHILDCKRSKQQMVMPIFYKVKPSHVRKQLGTFGKAFVDHERIFINGMEEVMTWRDALTEAADLHGWILEDGYISNHLITIAIYLRPVILTFYFFFWLEYLYLFIYFTYSPFSHSLSVFSPTEDALYPSLS